MIPLIAKNIEEVMIHFAYAKEHNCGVEVVLCSGTHIADQTVEIPSNSTLQGAGLGTIIRLANGVNGDVITNCDWTGDEKIAIKDLTLDGNAANQTHVVGDGPGQSGVSFVNVRDSYIENVCTFDTRLHGFDMNVRDVSGNNLNDAGCENVTIHGCTARSFGDDGFTTHWSKNIRIANCYASDPSSTYSNSSNGFEADDGSENIIISNSHAVRCAWGFVAQGHGGQNIPARHIIFDSCISEDASFHGFMATETTAGPSRPEYVTFNGGHAIGSDGFNINNYHNVRIISPTVEGGLGAQVTQTHEILTNLKIICPNWPTSTAGNQQFGVWVGANVMPSGVVVI